MPREMESDTFTSVHESLRQGSMLYSDNEAWKPQSCMKQYRAGSEESTGPADKRFCVVSLSATAHAGMVHVKEEDVVVEEVDGSGIELSSAAKEPYKVLKRAMKPMGYVYDFRFQWLLKAVEQSGADIFEGLQAVMYKPPYNTR